MPLTRARTAAAAPPRTGEHRRTEPHRRPRRARSQRGPSVRPSVRCLPPPWNCAQAAAPASAHTQMRAGGKEPHRASDTHSDGLGPRKASRPTPTDEKVTKKSSAKVLIIDAATQLQGKKADHACICMQSLSGYFYVTMKLNGNCTLRGDKCPRVDNSAI
jgi:hypothetical protein